MGGFSKRRHCLPQLLFVGLAASFGAVTTFSCHLFTWPARRARPSPVTLSCTGQGFFRPERCSVHKLKVGQQLFGKRRDLTRFGTYIDIGAERDAFLAAGEFRDGFPKEAQFYCGERIPVRILRIEEDVAYPRVWLTCRSGNLSRPDPFVKPLMNFQDLAAFGSLPPDAVLDAEVTEINFVGVNVKVQAPKSQVLQGWIHKSEFTPEFRDSAFVGMKVQVRFLPDSEGWKEKKRICLSMLDIAPARI
eukprot:TRINITY_DN68260_c0_g1_i1.p2 TRINITY_DN68260_c0_g1~~TRINITY_DN68260_c0_g1_i1.p2  ORF type:complete len:259 (-),score=44.52 TRINITY_DN68260_c0_g1_i1:129-869(-)